MNKEGRLKIYPKFKFAEEFQNGLAKVWEEDDHYYINIKGDKVFDLDD
ncbi:MAG: WG repeat-containing protein [Bacteroidota bacterium]